MGLLDAPAVDWRSRSLRLFRPERDMSIPCLAWYDASKLTLANGALIDMLPDHAGNGMAQASSGTARPVVKTNSLNGLTTMTMSATQFMASAAGLTVWDFPNRAQPLTYVALFKMRAAASAAAARAVFCTTGTSNTSGLIVAATTSSSTGNDSWAYPYAGAQGLGGGSGINDDNWHLVIVRMNAQGSTVLTDGYVTQAAVTAAHGTSGAGGRLVLGAFNVAGALPLDGEFAEGGFFAGELSMKECEALTDYFRAKWNFGPTYTPKQDTIVYRDFTDANGQSYRLFTKPGTTYDTSTPLLIWNHHQGGNTDFKPGIVGYTTLRAAVEDGWVAVVPTNHGTDGWSSPNAVADGPAAEAAAKGVLGISNFNRIVLAGMSMGGALAVIQARLATFAAPVKGVYTIDGALSLKWMYNTGGYKASIDTGFGIVTGTLSAAPAAGATSISSSVSFPNGTAIVIDPNGANPEYRTTNGAPSGTGPFTIPVPALSFAHASAVAVSDFPAKTSGRDPVALTAGQIPSGLRWRQVSSANDPIVQKAANNDAFYTLLGTASTVERGHITHSGGHLEVSAFKPDGFAAFLSRCT